MNPEGAPSVPRAVLVPPAPASLPWPDLTRRQEELLLHCHAAGYYEIPRRATLRDLARQLGVSAASLSLVLRRAENKAIAAVAAQLAARRGTAGPSGRRRSP